LEKLTERMKRVINPKTDRVRIYLVEKMEWVEGYILEPWESFKVF